MCRGAGVPRREHRSAHHDDHHGRHRPARTTDAKPHGMPPYGEVRPCRPLRRQPLARCFAALPPSGDPHRRGAPKSVLHEVARQRTCALARIPRDHRRRWPGQLLCHQTRARYGARPLARYGALCEYRGTRVRTGPRAADVSAAARALRLCSPSSRCGACMPGGDDIPVHKAVAVMPKEAKAGVACGFRKK